MERQVQYIPALISSIRKNTSGVVSYYNLYKDVLGPYMVTDLSATQIDALASYEIWEAKETKNMLPWGGDSRRGE